LGEAGGLTGIISPALARADQVNLMPSRHQAVHDPGHRHGDAVDFGRIGFCHEGDPETAATGIRQRTNSRAI
jgi:hypothetical protein